MEQKKKIDEIPNSNEPEDRQKLGKLKFLIIVVGAHGKRPYLFDKKALNQKWKHWILAKWGLCHE